MSSQTERHEFQAEVKQLLDLMIHSLYSHKDIFLRELISNSSDALDRLRFEALTKKELLPDKELEIRLEPDPKNRTLTLHDNGIGMSRQEIIEHIGTIARSGTREFLKAAKEKNQPMSAELIGQFGVGFYSSFMVSDKIMIVTRRAGEAEAVRWESTGEGGYALEAAERAEPGTSVTLYLKPEDAEDGMQDYASEHVLRSIVTKYSDFVSYPIRMKVEKREPERDADGTYKAGAPEKVVIEDVTLNSMKAIWTRPKNEVGEQEYKDFYKHIAHDWNDPLETIVAKLEGNFEANLLLFIPSKAPFDFRFRDSIHRGIQLYVKRVFIMDECKDLLPEYLHFVRGVVDSDGLSLNVSREILQQDRQIKAIRNHVIKKVLETLKEIQDSQAEKYLTFWKEFGAFFKQGLLDWEEKQERLLPLLMIQSNHHATDFTTLKDYISRMKPEQNTIYYLNGPSREVVGHSPHLEAFQQKGFEVLFLTDPIDELWTGRISEFEGKKFQSIGKGSIDLGSEEEKKESEETRKNQEKQYKDLLECLKSGLEQDIKEVRLSNRLTSSPACLVSEAHDLSPQMEMLMKQMGQSTSHTKRILEVNPAHPLLGKLQKVFDADSKNPLLSDFAKLLYGQALLAEGSPLPDPAAYSQLIAELMMKAI